MSVIALVDCNNFYASCERIFRPDLFSKPVVVLSNNDGCVIARSNEAKAVGIKMGEPYFKCKDLISRHNISVFSSNFALYGDISNRVMSILRNFCSNLEVYSVDEAFLDLSSVPVYKLDSYVRTIRQTIYQWLGITVSIGVAKSKTLAKMANYFVKRNTAFHGVLNLLNRSKTDLFKMLDQFPVEEIWGVGRKYALMLRSYSIKTASDLLRQTPNWVRSKMTINGLKTYNELMGVACFEFSFNPDPKKNIVSSKSFGEPVHLKSELEVALSNYTTRLSEKLRMQNSECALVGVFVESSRFSKSEKYYSNSLCLSLPGPSNCTSVLIKHAKHALDKIFVNGVRYKKIGVFASQISCADRLQLDLFDTSIDIKKSKQKSLMQTIDKLNSSFGSASVSMAACLGGDKWKMKRESRSPRYTTCLNELKLIKI
jgi:DNA polymerase V